MNWNDYVTLALSLGAAIFSIWSFFFERKRNMREATIHAFDTLEDTVFNAESGALNKILREDAQTIVTSLRADPNDMWVSPRLKNISKKLALIEHFAVGVNFGTYDVTVVNAMAGNMLISMWYSLEPIIMYKRENEGDAGNYKELEKMICSIKEKRGQA